MVQLRGRAEVRFRRCPSHPRATTSASRSRRTAPRCRCTSTWWRWTRPTTHGRVPILSRLLTPSRLKANQDFLWELADRQLDEFVDSGECEFLTAYSKPFSLLAIADLLGVPREDHKEFRAALASPHLMGNIEGDAAAINPLEFLDEKFSAYIEERRAEPRDDVLSELAAATYPDGSQPAVTEVVRTASFLFGAGQETTAKLLGAALRILCDRPELAADAARGPSLVPGVRRGDAAHGEPRQDRIPAWRSSRPALPEWTFPRARR